MPDRLSGNAAGTHAGTKLVAVAMAAMSTVEIVCSCYRAEQPHSPAPSRSIALICIQYTDLLTALQRWMGTSAEYGFVAIAVAGDDCGGGGCTAACASSALARPLNAETLIMHASAALRGHMIPQRLPADSLGLLHILIDI